MPLGHTIVEGSSLRVLHTSDLHLSAGNPRTLEALEHILDVARQENADIVTIAGDMFDSARDANELRPQLRDLLSENGFEILVLPGNHDATAFTQNTFYGNDVFPLIDKPVTVREYEDLLIAGVPFRERLDDDVALRIREVSDFTGTKILLLHCTLDIGLGSGGFGEEEAIRYMPVSSAKLAGLGFDYILAGHFHSSLHEQKLASGGLFVYPGSPVSLTRKERGRRSAYLIDTESKKTQAIELSTFYCDELEVTISPGTEKAWVEQIEQWAKHHKGKNCDVRVIAKGFTEMPEAELKQQIEAAAGGIHVDFRVRGIENILRYPIYQRFKQRLLNDDGIDDKERVDMMMLTVVSRLAEEGELDL